MKGKVKTVIIPLVATMLFVSGCAGIGPGTVARDRFDYTAAISESWKSQMLLNMVKMRYGDAPVFLDVVSVINQYAVEGQVDLRASWGSPRPNFGNIFGIGGLGKYTDRPTITYNPLTGERFTRSLMTPIPPATMWSLVQAGYPIDLVFRLSVHSINGVENRYGGAVRMRAADPEFYPLLEKMRKIQASGAIGFKVQKLAEREAILLVFKEKVSEEIETASREVRQILGLDPQAQEFRVVYGSISTSSKEIAILTRSFIEIIIDLASYIEVPQAHVMERRVNPTFVEEPVTGVSVPPLVQIFSSGGKPDDSFASVHYRGHWFWIDDKDLPSKRLFSFLMFIFTLTETGGKEGAPIVTIPAG